MTGTFQSLDLFLLGCLFLMAEAQTVQVLPPNNVSLTWVDGMFPVLSWAPPEQSAQNCTYEMNILTKKSNQTYQCHYSSSKISCTEELPFLVTIMYGGFVSFSVKTKCNGISSEPVGIVYNVTDLVTSWQCIINSSSSAHCSWQPGPDAPPDLGFFYVLADENNPCGSTPSQECPSYTYTNGKRTGCNLPANINHAICILFSGMVNNVLVRNTHIENVLKVRLPPLNWIVTETADKFYISWTPPDVLPLQYWTYKINYTRCDQSEILEMKVETSVELVREANCQYHMVIKAVGSDKEETEWSQEKTFNPIKTPNLSLLAAIMIPLVFAVLAVLTLVCCRKNKENLFPKVPKPRDLLSDISDNNNKSTLYNMYVPAKEEEDCKITLVIDPKLNKPDF